MPQKVGVGKPEQIVQKLAEDLADGFIGVFDTPIGRNALVKFFKRKLELQPLADLIRAAEDLLTEDMCNGKRTVEMDGSEPERAVRAALDKLAGE